MPINHPHELLCFGPISGGTKKKKQQLPPAPSPKSTPSELIDGSEDNQFDATGNPNNNDDGDKDDGNDDGVSDEGDGEDEEEEGNILMLSGFYLLPKYPPSVFPLPALYSLFNFLLTRCS